MMKARIGAAAAKANTTLALRLHGKTIIELFDAANGEKVYEQVDENMATNALQRLVNLPAEFTVMDNVSNRACLPALYMPFLSKALSGLWVFSKIKSVRLDEVCIRSFRIIITPIIPALFHRLFS